MSYVKKFKKKKNKVGGRFLALPHAVINSGNFIALSAKAVKLLMDIGVQYAGGNNGDLQATWSYMKTRGWKSRDTLNAALQELLHYGFIEKTRQGYMNVCSLFALTWRPIDDRTEKYDAGVRQTYVASHQWKEIKDRHKRSKKRNANTNFNDSRPDHRDNEARMAA